MPSRKNNVIQIISNLYKPQTEYEVIDRIQHIHALLVNYKLGSLNMKLEPLLIPASAILRCDGEVWKVRIAYQLAELCFCEIDPNENPFSYTFIGENLNCDILNYLFHMIISAIENESTDISLNEYTMINKQFVESSQTASSYRISTYCSKLITSIKSGFVLGEKSDHNPKLTNFYK